MYTMKKGFKNKKIGAFLGMLFAVFAVIASFGIGNMTQANSISESLKSTFNFDEKIVGVVLTVLAIVIILMIFLVLPAFAELSQRYLQL